MKEFITRNINLHSGCVEEKREEILNYFTKTYTLFEKLFDDVFVNDDVFYSQPEPLRHKLIFYYGHTATFFINKLILGKFIKERINPHFESIFAIGVDEMSWDDLNNDNYAWPKVQEVREYRQKAKKIITSYIQTCEFSLPISWENPMWVIIMGIEHEKIHIETSSVLHRQLPIECVKPNSFGKECKEYGNHPLNELLDVPASHIVLNKQKESEFYGWDNEYGFYEEQTPAFKASKYLVSNGEFLEFVQDNGYKKDEFWSKEGIAWKSYKNAQHPIFWISKDDSYDYRILTNVIKLPLNWPVDVNHLEAQAFCVWKSQQTNSTITLPREALWHAIKEFSQAPDEKEWGEVAPFNINLEHFTSSCPVNTFQSNGFYDVLGNVWQWTNTTIDGFEGFEIHPLYDDFSVPTFDGRHNIFKGGSFISTGNEVLKESRYAFRRHFPQHAGFRYVQVDSTYNQITATSQQIIEDTHASFFVEAIKTVKNYLKNHKTNSALNLGCYYGTASFLLSQHYKNVTGIDFTARNILNAQNTKEQQKVKNCQFWQGDSCNLKPYLKGYDLILVTNDFNELYCVETFLNELPKRLNENGVLIIQGRNIQNVEAISSTLNTLLTPIGHFAWKK